MALHCACAVRAACVGRAVVLNVDMLALLWTCVVPGGGHPTRHGPSNPCRRPNTRFPRVVVATRACGHRFLPLDRTYTVKGYGAR
jgi:hypothetical protein